MFDACQLSGPTPYLYATLGEADKKDQVHPPLGLLKLSKDLHLRVGGYAFQFRQSGFRAQALAAILTCFSNLFQ